jgi:hypothetical protein
MATFDEATLKGFMRLYRGRTDAWGLVEGGCVKETVTEENYRLHLSGQKSLGVYMLRDDGTNWFFEIDLDEKDFEKAKRVKQAFSEDEMPVYISESKSKGYHITGFAGDKPFIAKEIRIIGNTILKRLGIKAEFFPKQDKLDGTRLPYGNYINLPCFGETRTFLTADKEPVPLVTALQHIVPISENAYKTALLSTPQPTTPVASVVPPADGKKSSKKKGGHPPCIENILNHGIKEGEGRDNAAFALARHLLDQSFLDDEVLAMMVLWDRKNDPPLGEPELREKITSAKKGYAFGCNSVHNDANLGQFCVGTEYCPWIKKATKDKMAKGIIRERSFHETETHLYEQIAGKNPIDGSVESAFVAYTKATGKYEILKTIDYPNFQIVPRSGMENIKLPTGVAEYGDTLTLVAEIRRFIRAWVDLPVIAEEFTAWYVVMSWVYDRLTTVCYLHFRGDQGTGKSRALETTSELSYKTCSTTGCVGPAPVFRLIKKWRGAFAFDEADLDKEDKDLTQILLAGFQRNGNVIRCDPDDPDNVQVYPVFGPKILSSRNDFEEPALESRCFVVQTEETDRTDIPSNTDDTFYEKTAELRNKLLLYRLRNYSLINNKEVRTIDLGPNLDGRLRQIAQPFALVFKDMPEVMTAFRAFLKEHQKTIIEDRSDNEQGKVVEGFLSLALTEGKNNVTVAMVSNYCNDTLKVEIKPQRVGQILKSMKYVTKRINQNKTTSIEWNPRIVRKTMKKYVSDPERFTELFTEPPIVAQPDDLDTQF